MANIALRNPQFKSIDITQSFKSVVCTVTIDSVLRYTLIKNIDDVGTVVFDIAELARDYLEITFQTNYEPQVVQIATALTPYAESNGGGQAGTATNFDDRGFEAYGTFEEGVNPEIPFGRSLPTFLIPINEDTDTFTIFAPNNRTGKIPYITSTFRDAVDYTATDTVVTAQGVDCNIKRIDCTKYGEGNRITYINKYGVQQDLWFFLKQNKNIARTNEGYKSNTITYPSGGATYSIQDAPNKVFNTQAKQTHTLSSGYYPEFANQFFEELLLSEYVWLSKFVSGVVAETYVNIPVKVKTSSVAFKTSVNDRLIEYTIEFEEAFDYINNIR
tara:strand:- start:1258 stop:2247 length:990 start_codon:yes stop_codon:yes gene_type:complete